jgi:alkylation response protein AidB-like acyl-CoA dehydrogenase
MSDKLADIRNLRFMVYEVLKAEELTQHEYFQDHSKETFDMAIDAAYQMAQEVFWPSLRPLDREGPTFDGTKTTVPPLMHEVYRQAVEAGWTAPSADYEYGGQQFPLTITNTGAFLLNAGNSPALMYVGSATGAADLLSSFATQELKDLYAEKLYSGQWGGTMALTEPHAGSSLGDITATAVKSPDGDHYMIKGVKRFISSGDHDLTENIIHPTLVRIEGAPSGVKGISMMLVPKYRPDENGNAGEFNDVNTAGIEDKLGLKLSTTATLNFGENDDCHGWLLGEENKGLSHMFQLMNHARINTGSQGVAGASAAYYCALEYANDRVQGRELTNKDAKLPPIPIIRHADVRRMLLHQKAYIEGALGLVLFASNLMDKIKVADNEEERKRLHNILEVTTPIIKAHGSEGSFDSVTTALQCFGGAGYTEEVPIAQLLRDSKVYSIYEGTTGIQAMDLLGRKLTMNNGAASMAMMEEVTKTLEEAKTIESIKPLAEKAENLQSKIAETLMGLFSVAQTGDTNLFMCNATPFLEAFSQMLMSWQWVSQAIVAQQALDAGTDETDFYEAKLKTAQYYINWVTPQALATLSTIQTNERTALDFKEEWF